MHDTNTAAMATLFDEWFKPESFLEYPKGGSESIVNALINGLKKNGGRLLLSSKVKAINIKNNLATGVTLENGSVYNSESVVMNVDFWNSIKLIPSEISKRWRSNVLVRKCDSFLHIHLGFDADGIENLPIIQYMKIGRGITAERNIVVFSIPSVLDKRMAPEGKHVLHGYTPANEPWEIWEALDPYSSAYKKLKKKDNVFINALGKIIPDIDNRIEIKMLGTMSHRKFTNTYW